LSCAFLLLPLLLLLSSLCSLLLERKCPEKRIWSGCLRTQTMHSIFLCRWLWAFGMVLSIVTCVSVQLYVIISYKREKRNIRRLKVWCAESFCLSLAPFSYFLLIRRQLVSGIVVVWIFKAS
jgi:hypothetical protein